MEKTLTQHYPVAKPKPEKTAQKLNNDDKQKQVQEETFDVEKYLRDFDQNYEYGPSQNITRLERWERAEKFDMNPPLKVKEIILSDPKKYIHPFWNEYKLLD